MSSPFPSTHFSSAYVPPSPPPTPSPPYFSPSHFPPPPPPTPSPPYFSPSHFPPPPSAPPNQSNSPTPGYSPRYIYKKPLGINPIKVNTIKTNINTFRLPSPPLHYNPFLSGQNPIKQQLSPENVPSMLMPMPSVSKSSVLEKRRRRKGLIYPPGFFNNK